MWNLDPPSDLDAILASINPMPTFSIVVPVYNTPPSLLKALVNSVLGQWVPNWELILVDDASPSLETQAALKDLDHPQIKIIRLPTNQGISGATNAGIQAASSQTIAPAFIVFLDHDDEITPDCLYELAPLHPQSRTGLHLQR